MRTKFFFRITPLGVMAMATLLTAAGLQRTTRFDFKAGFGDHAEASSVVSPIGVVSNSYESSSGVASMGLGLHIRRGLWGDLRIGVQALDVTSEVLGYNTWNHAVALMPLMIGFRAYPLHREETGFQPYFSAAAGPIIGVEATQKVGVVIINESHSETTVGANVGGGVDLLLTSWFGFEISGGYTFMNDFAKPLGGETNFNGWDASFGICFFLGRQ